MKSLVFVQQHLYDRQNLGADLKIYLETWYSLLFLNFFAQMIRIQFFLVVVEYHLTGFTLIQINLFDKHQSFNILRSHAVMDGFLDIKFVSSAKSIKLKFVRSLM